MRVIIERRNAEYYEMLAFVVEETVGSKIWRSGYDFMLSKDTHHTKCVDIKSSYWINI